GGDLLAIVVRVLDQALQLAFERWVERELRADEIGVPDAQLLPVGYGRDVHVRRDLRDSRAAGFARQGWNPMRLPGKDLEAVRLGDHRRGHLFRMHEYLLHRPRQQTRAFEPRRA